MSPHTEVAPAPATTAPADVRSVDVLYLAGYGRSGSTVLGRLLGERPGSAFVGELNFFWSDGVLAGRPCGCGVPMTECDPWATVLERLGPDVEDRARHVTALLAATTRMRHGFAGLTARGARSLEPRLRELGGHLDALYTAIREVFGADLIVDSSKSLAYRRALQYAPGLTVHTVHLVRDPRATSVAWQSPKAEPVGSFALPTFGAGRAAVEWTLTNTLALRLDGPSVRMRYEDLMLEPAGELADAAAVLELDLVGLPIRGRRTSLGVAHSVAGNPDRFATGPVELAADHRWRERITRAETALVDAITRPVRHRVGYPGYRR